jgi:8-oxo-dGTP pyrophosphatase MutT (NUDIX family)
VAGAGAHASVHDVATCLLRAGDGAWDFGAKNAAAIETHWQARLQTHPGYFNGVIHVMNAHRMDASHFEADFIPTDFKTFLYWKDHGYCTPEADDAFGSAIIQSAEGHVLLGRQAAGHLNSGLYYLPGGFIDPRDISANGTIDIVASVAREIGEETGLTTADLTRRPGFLITRVGRLVSIGVTFQSPLPGAELRARILANLSAMRDCELDDIALVGDVGALAELAVPPYAAFAVQHLLRAP